MKVKVRIQRAFSRAIQDSALCSEPSRELRKGLIAVSGGWSFCRRCFRRGRGRCFRGLAVLGLEVFVAQARGAMSMLTAFLEGAGFVARLGHFAGLPEPKMLPAKTLADRLARAIFRFAVSFIRHESLLGSRFPDASAENRG
jgi:hypothetical protein